MYPLAFKFPPMKDRYVIPISINVLKIVRKVSEYGFWSEQNWDQSIGHQIGRTMELGYLTLY